MQHDAGDGVEAALDAVAACLASCCYAAAAPLFPLKWRLLQEKLSRLRAALSAVAGDEDGAPGVLIRSVLSTADRVQALVDRCSSDVGRLRLRSDLDAVTSTIDGLVKRLDELHAAAGIADQQALVVQPPGAGASREDMRFYVNHLFVRLKAAGGCTMQAMAALNAALRADDKYVRVLATDVDDGIATLVAHIGCSDDATREEALAAVSTVAGFECYRGAVVLAGAIPSLIRVLEAGTAPARVRAARCLKKLTENSDNAWAVAAQGGVTALLILCRDTDTCDGAGAETVAAALSVLRSLSAVEEIKKFMVDAGGVSVMAAVAESSPDEAVQVTAMEFLAAVAGDDPAARQLAVRAGAVDALIRILDPGAEHRSTKAREVALRTIDAVCFPSASSTSHLLRSGLFLESMLAFLKHGREGPMQQTALKAVRRLSAMSDDVKKALGEAGFVPELVRVLEVASADVRETAAEALIGMVTVQKNMRRLVQEDCSSVVVGRMLQLLERGDERPATRRFVLAVLSRVVESSSGRRKVASSEHVGCLERIAETDGDEAKHIVKKIAGGRWRSMVGGILKKRSQLK